MEFLDITIKWVLLKFVQVVAPPLLSAKYWPINLNATNNH